MSAVPVAVLEKVSPTLNAFTESRSPKDISIARPSLSVTLRNGDTINYCGIKQLK